MSNPTRIPIIVGGIVGVVAMALCLFLPKDEQKDPSLQNTKPTTGIQIQVPTGPTDPTEIPPVIVIPGDNDPTTPTDPAGPTQPIPGNPVVEGSDEEDDIKDDEEIVIGNQLAAIRSQLVAPVGVVIGVCRSCLVPPGLPMESQGILFGWCGG